MTDPRDTARRDQVDAAERTAARVFDGYRTGLPGGGTEHQTPDRTPAWLTALAERHNAIVASGVVHTCSHLAPGRGPAVRCLLAWYPGAVICPECVAAGAGMPARGSIDDQTCDGCNRYMRQGVRVSVIRLDPITLFHLGLCDRCRADLAGSQ